MKKFSLGLCSLLVSILSANAAGVQNPPAAVDTVLVNDLGTYKGEYPVGKGVLFSDTWGVIKGKFKDGLPHGRCVLHDYRPFRYVGQFSEGHITGYGQFFYDNGQVETGWYENGRASGVDTVYYRDGRVYIGLFENNKKVKGKGTEYEKMPDFLKGRKPQYHEPLLSVEELNFYNEAYEKLTADDHKPTFQGQNMNTFAKWVDARLKYPKEARKHRIEGRVTLGFIVDKAGEVKDIKVLRSVDPLLDAEPVRVVGMSPLWERSVQYGRKVNFRVVIPVIFSLR